MPVQFRLQSNSALLLNEEDAIPALKQFIKTSQNPTYAAEKLACIKDVDITEELKAAANNVHHAWGQSRLSKTMLDKGMPEGLDLAYKVLKSKAPHSEYSKQQVSNYLYKYTDAKGTYDDMATWIEENKDSLSWNDTDRRFE